MPTYFGFDASLTNTGAARVYINKAGVIDHRLRLIQTDSGDGIDHRLHFIRSAVYDFIGTDTTAKFGIEGFSFGARFQREAMGMASAAVRLGIPVPPRAAWTSGDVVRIVTPAAAKAAACPHWHGFTKTNWITAGRKGEFKRSMPPKESVIAGLYTRFKIDARNEHEADAVCVALALAIRDGINIKGV